MGLQWSGWGTAITVSSRISVTSRGLQVWREDVWRWRWRWRRRRRVRLVYFPLLRGVPERASRRSSDRGRSAARWDPSAAASCPPSRARGCVALSELSTAPCGEQRNPVSPFSDADEEFARTAPSAPSVVGLRPLRGESLCVHSVANLTTFPQVRGHSWHSSLTAGRSVARCPRCGRPSGAEQLCGGARAVVFAAFT